MINRSNLGFFLKGKIQDKQPVGAGKFKSMWLGPYVVSKVLKKGAYELTYFEENKLPEPRNGLYLKKYYA